MRRFVALAVTLAVALGSFSSLDAQEKVVFQSWAQTAPTFAAFAPGNGVLGIEDYIPSEPLYLDTISSFRFVGGVDTVGGVLDFNFYDDSLTLVNSAAISLGSAGNFFWTINLGPGFTVAPTGFMEIVLDPSRLQNTGVNGQWFLDDVGTPIGSSPQNVGVGAPFNFAFELRTVPEPATAGLLGAFLVGMVVRRRR